MSFGSCCRTALRAQSLGTDAEHGGFTQGDSLKGKGGYRLLGRTRRGKLTQICSSRKPTRLGALLGGQPGRHNQCREDLELATLGVVDSVGLVLHHVDSALLLIIVNVASDHTARTLKNEVNRFLGAWVKFDAAVFVHVVLGEKVAVAVETDLLVLSELVASVVEAEMTDWSEGQGCVFLLRCLTTWLTRAVLCFAV